MKTISGNPQMIDESILSSVGKGRDNVIQDFLKSAFMSQQYKLLPDMSISLIDENVLLRNRADIPVWIHDCTIVQIVNCGITDFKLPMSAKTVILEDCKNLKNIITNCSDSMWCNKKGIKLMDIIFRKARVFRKIYFLSHLPSTVI